MFANRLKFYRNLISALLIANDLKECLFVCVFSIYTTKDSIVIGGAGFPLNNNNIEWIRVGDEGVIGGLIAALGVFTKGITYIISLEEVVWIF